MATRRIHSVQRELLEKSKQAALSAVQSFNNPLSTFKSETFIVLMVIAWTYLLHAHYRHAGIEYRYYRQRTKRRRFERTKSGAFKFWGLERCLSDTACPLDSSTIANLRFLIGLRNEIEHHRPTGLDDFLGGRYLACCLNYETWLTKLFGNSQSVAASMVLALQFRALAENAEPAEGTDRLPANIARYITDFDAGLGEEDYQSPHFSYNVIFTRRLVNHRGQAARAIEFIPADSELAKAMDAQYVVLKPIEKPKFRPSDVVQIMQEDGFSRFGMHQHTELWKRLDAKYLADYGVDISGQWYWYQTWVDRVRKECSSDTEKYT